MAVEVVHIKTNQDNMNDLEDLVEQVLLWLRILYKFGSQTIHRPFKRNLGGSFYK